jgi:hypothetical protein
MSEETKSALLTLGIVCQQMLINQILICKVLTNDVSGVSKQTQEALEGTVKDNLERHKIISESLKALAAL